MAGITDNLEGMGTIGNNARRTYSEQQGWKWREHSRGPSHQSDSYEKGGVTVWRIQDGWQTAILSLGQYTNHKAYKTFVEALEQAPGHHAKALAAKQ